MTALLPGGYVVQTDNEQVRVTQWTLPAGSETGHHRHEFDYAVVPVTDGILTIATVGGETKEFVLHAGESYFRPAGVEHNVMNLGTSPDVVFVEVEIK